MEFPAVAADLTIAATTSFQASVKGPLSGLGSNRSATLPFWPACSDGSFTCGQASIAGFGSASYSFALDSFAPISSSCGEYHATVLFVLADGSTLTLSESGTVCGPGGSFIGVPAPGGSFGNPVEGAGAWVVENGTGEFAGMTGSGTDEFLSAGANFIARYWGVVNT